MTDPTMIDELLNQHADLVGDFARAIRSGDLTDGTMARLRLDQWVEWTLCAAYPEAAHLRAVQREADLAEMIDHYRALDGLNAGGWDDAHA